MSNYLTYRISEHLIPLKLGNKEQYIRDLIFIEDSWTGRLDAQSTNTFVSESAYLIINSIELFEKGYFDCAYYSLRQSLEISTTMAYLMELDETTREKKFLDWRRQDEFPMYGAMMKFMKGNKGNFADMKLKMNSYFADLDDAKRKLNKHVHKQGFHNFYTIRQYNSKKDRTTEIERFESYVRIGIGAAAVMRLVIDPFPILLMDNEIYLRTFDTITQPFSIDFVERYIGLEHIENYKLTDLYASHHESYMTEEEKLESVAEVVKNQYVAQEKITEILSQKHLLSERDLIAVSVFKVSKKITKVYLYGGMQWYFTDIERIPEKTSFNSQDLHKPEASNQELNIEYGGAFLSYLEIRGQDYFFDHNEELSQDDVSLILAEINGHFETEKTSE